jgi:hypothetical protein
MMIMNERLVKYTEITLKSFTFMFTYTCLVDNVSSPALKVRYTLMRH